MIAKTFFETYEEGVFISKPFRDLLKAKFEPKEVRKYFKGWEIDTYSDQEVKDAVIYTTIIKRSYINSSGKLLSDEIGFVYSDKYSEYDIILFKDCDESFIMPTNLDQFISDCQRVGIELEWTDEIANNLMSNT